MDAWLHSLALKMVVDIQELFLIGQNEKEVAKNGGKIQIGVLISPLSQFDHYK